MLSNLNVTAFKGSGGSIFRVDDFFMAVQVSRPGVRDVNVPAGDIGCVTSIPGYGRVWYKKFGSEICICMVSRHTGGKIGWAIRHFLQCESSTYVIRSFYPAWANFYLTEESCFGHCGFSTVSGCHCLYNKSKDARLHDSFILFPLKFHIANAYTY